MELNSVTLQVMYRYCHELQFETLDCCKQNIKISYITIYNFPVPSHSYYYLIVKRIFAFSPSPLPEFMKYILLVILASSCNEI